MCRDLLGRVRDRAPPRDDDLSREAAARVEGRFGVVRFAIACLALITNSVVAALAVAAAPAARAWLGPTMPRWFAAVLGTSMLAAVWLSLVPFRRWVQRRRRATAELGRHGILLDGTAYAWTVSARGTKRLTVIAEHDGVAHCVRSTIRPGVKRAEAAPGAPFPVLYLPGRRFAMHITPRGDGVPAEAPT